MISFKLKRYNGPVRIIRRFNDEVVTAYHGPDELRRRRENRGNYLLLRFLQDRYPDIVQNDEDAKTVLNYLDIGDFGEERAACIESRNSLDHYELDYVLANADLKQHLIRLLCFSHFYDVQAAHVTPLKSEEFILPHEVNFRNFDAFLRSLDNLYN